MSNDDREQLEWLRTRDYPDMGEPAGSSTRRPRSAAADAAHLPGAVRPRDEAGACPDQSRADDWLGQRGHRRGHHVHGSRPAHRGTVGPENGLNHGSVVNLADIQTIRQMDLGRHVGYLVPRGEPALTAAVAAAFGLDP